MEDIFSFEDAYNNDGGFPWEILDEEGKVTPELEEEEDNDPPEEGNDPPEETEGSTSFSDLENEEGEPAEEEETDDDPFSVLVSHWNSEGIVELPEDLKEIKDENDIASVIKYTVDKGINAYKESFSPEVQELIDYMDKGGNPSDFIKVYEETSPADFDIENEDGQRSLVTEYYKNKGLAEKRISKMIEDLEDSDELEEESKVAQTFFRESREKEKENLKRIEEERLEAQRKQDEEVSKELDQLIADNELIRDIPIKSKKEKEELKSYVMDKKVRYDDPNTGRSFMITQYQKDKMDRLSNKETKYEDFLFDALMTKNKFDTTTLKKRGVTEHNSKIRDAVAKANNKNRSSKLASSGGKRRKETFSDVSWDDL